MSKKLLEIQNLRAGTEDKEILRGISLAIQPGEVHAIMGQNGSGKSTLAYVLAGKPGYEVFGGSVWMNGKDLLSMEPEERAGEGLFLAFQYPVEIPGLNMSTFLRHAVNEVRQYRGLDPLDAKNFLKLVREKVQELGLSSDFLKRAVNAGFSGGEKKKNEILQLLLLEPSLVILDETDSGLDLDALKQVTEHILRLKSPERSFLIITHYPKLLEYLKPDVVHVMDDGQILCSGGWEVVKDLEEHGFENIRQSVLNAP